MNSSCIVVVMS